MQVIVLSKPPTPGGRGIRPVGVTPHLTFPRSKGGGSSVVMLRRPLEGGFLMPPALRLERHCLVLFGSERDPAQSCSEAVVCWQGPHGTLCPGR